MSNEIEPHVRQTAQQLKQKFLEDAAPLVQQYVDAALGVADFNSMNAGAREEVWGVLKQLMLQSSDKLELDIQTAEDVLEAVSQGKCTFEEGEKLLSLFKKVKDIETAGQLPGGPGTGLQITILAGDGNVKVEQPQILEGESHAIEEPKEQRS